MVLAIIARGLFQNCPKYHEPRSVEWYLDNFEILRTGIFCNIPSACQSIIFFSIIP